MTHAPEDGASGKPPRYAHRSPQRGWGLRAYLGSFTFASYVRRVFSAENYRAVIGLGAGLVCALAGAAKFVARPGHASVCLTAGGLAVAAFFFALPFVFDLLLATLESLSARRFRRRRIDSERDD